MKLLLLFFLFFFFNDTATTEIYTLSLHDALPISQNGVQIAPATLTVGTSAGATLEFNTVTSTTTAADRKSTRLNSSHLVISYAVFCLKKKKQENLLIHGHTSR